MIGWDISCIIIEKWIRPRTLPISLQNKENLMVLFIIFVIIPLIEIALFIVVGGEIGIFATLLLCVIMAITGSMLVRQQGLKTLFAAKDAMERGELPVKELFDGICIAALYLCLLAMLLRLKQICNFDPATGESSKLERLGEDKSEPATASRASDQEGQMGPSYAAKPMAAKRLLPAGNVKSN